jgi:hypothetical protein
MAHFSPNKTKTKQLHSTPFDRQIRRCGYLVRPKVLAVNTPTNNEQTFIVSKSIRDGHDTVVTDVVVVEVE